VRAMLDLARLRSGETFVDIGAGDGRVLLEAVLTYDAGRAVGFELDPAVHAIGLAHIKGVCVRERVAYVPYLSGGTHAQSAPRVSTHSVWHREVDRSHTRQTAGTSSVSAKSATTLPTHQKALSRAQRETEVSVQNQASSVVPPS
jgi:hypothetical protein